MAPVNSFGSLNLRDITTCIARASYSGHWDGLGKSYCYFSGIIAIIYYIIAEFWICTLLESIVLENQEKFDEIKDN